MGLSWLPLLPVLGAFAQSAKVQLPAVGAEPPKVISHIGRTPDAGHYVYYNRSQIGVWICYDDDKCFEVEASEVLSSQAYLVLYVSSIQDDFGERAEKLEKSPERDRSRSRGRADRPSQDKQKPEHGELVESRPELEVESLVKNGWFGRDIGSPSLALRSCHLWTRAPRYLPVWNGHTALQRLRAHISAQQLLIRLSQLHRIRTSAAPKDLIPLDEVVEVHDQKYVRRPATTLFPARPGHLRPEVPIEEELRNQRRSRDKIFERMWKAASSSNAMLSWDCEVCKALAGQNCYM